MSSDPWIDLDGTVNTRRPAGVAHLIRSDNLQDLTPADVERLLGEYEVRAVADLRTSVEVASEGPAPLDEHIDVRRLSLFPESGHLTDVLVDQNPVLPWQNRSEITPDRQGAVRVYLGYLEDRPDSVIEALRLIAHTDGTTIVHCAAGKDRTGVVVALALAEVGVDDEAIIADYARTSERGELLLARLAGSKTYANDVSGKPASYHLPKADTMRAFLAAMQSEHDGPAGWLRAHGWTDADAAALRRQLAN